MVKSGLKNPSTGKTILHTMEDFFPKSQIQEHKYQSSQIEGFQNKVVQDFLQKWMIFFYLPFFSYHFVLMLPSEIRLFQSLNHHEGNLKVAAFNQDNIIPNSSTTLHSSS